LAVFAGFYLPSLAPARGAPVSQSVWLVGSVLLLLCVVASVMALFWKARPDRIAGVLGGGLTLWMIYAFYNAIS
jgi:hypothetical protein